MGGKEIASFDQSFQSGQTANEPFGHPVPHRRRLLVDNHHCQGLLRWEMKIHRPLAKPSSGDDVVETHHAVRSSGELAGSRAHNLPARAVWSTAIWLRHQTILRSKVAVPPALPRE